MPGYGDFTMPPPAKQTAASLASEGAEPKKLECIERAREECGADG